VPQAWFPEDDSPEAVKKLRRYFRRVGFERIGRSPYYSLTMARVTPNLADLLKPVRG
jgi:hypothetical protein